MESSCRIISRMLWHHALYFIDLSWVRILFFILLLLLLYYILILISRGFTEDLHIALKEISIRYPNAPIGLAGFSMGGNNIAKYLGERDSKIRPTKIYQHLE